jgi:hypothetical protein
MGTWGQGIFQDDLAADVRAAWEAALAEGLGTDEATARVIRSVRPPRGPNLGQFRDSFEDDDKVFWLALAAAQSERGRLQPEIRERALAIIEAGGDLDRPERVEAGPVAIGRRRRALEQLAAKLRGPQPKPSRPRCPRLRSERRRERRPAYPFEPKSNTWLEPGQFWGVPLSDGRFACGRVLAVPDEREPDPMLWSERDARMFFAGLMDWVAENPPTSEAITGASLVAQGMAHVKTIRENGRFVLGDRDLSLDGVVGLREVTHRGGGVVYLYEGARRVRPATREEAASLPVMGTWGYRVISVLAERLFVEGKPIART